MARGMSLHVGINSVDPVQYGGWSGDLAACEFDAHDMTAIAKSGGYEPTTLLTQDATSVALLGYLASAAQELRAGDTLLITYSGHGGQIPDLTGDEEDGQDETWVLYDRQVIDDELYRAYGAFAEGVRIAVFSDSCHSGTVTRMGPPVPAGAGGGAPVAAVAPVDVARNRAMPPARALRDFQDRRAAYAAAKGEEPVDVDAIGASVVLISGCQDNQLSLDGTYNGLFTATLLTVWNGGKFRGGYARFRDRIARRMPDRQTPAYSMIGRQDRDFARSTPFTL